MIVGCDYSTQFIDLAVRTPYGHWDYTKVGARFETLPINLLGQVLGVYAEWGNPVLYIEQPWSRYNPATAMLMTKVATLAQVVALQKGYRVEWAHVASWRSRVFGKGKYAGKAAKERSLVAARELTEDEELADHNVADAVCIARYGELREQDG